MNILMIYPKLPSDFWSNTHILSLFRKKAHMPPLGLLTVAAMMPDEEFVKKVIDMNYQDLQDEDILWADYVFISAMIAHKSSIKEVLVKCSKMEAKIVAGGPLFTTTYDDYPEIKHFVLGESESIMPRFLEDLKNGTAERLYINTEKPDIKNSPIPRFDLIDLNEYLHIGLQFSRGCPYNCEFCEITTTYGKRPRCKTSEQFITEMDYAIQLGWKGRIAVVDDNFIVNKNQTKELLKKIVEWRKKTGFDCLFITQLPITAADDDELLELLSDAGFCIVFIGIETPSESGLEECGKVQNINRNLIESVRKFQKHGIKVAGGFIVGFDSDDLSIFDRQLNFIQEAGIPQAMISLLKAMPNTKLFEKLKKEDRIIDDSDAINFLLSMNIKPLMDTEILISRFKNLIRLAYSPKIYYKRVLKLMENYNPVIKLDLRKTYLMAGGLTILQLGFLSKGRLEFWKFVLISLIKHPKSFFWCMDSVIPYVHFKKVCEETLAS